MEIKQFYVYGLIDPRTKSIFYIGKGKGKRVLRHITEVESVLSNPEKLKIIKEIQSEGLEVEHIFIGENLNEDAAFLLERILIYRLGRKIFDEGILTNIAPGGRWTKDESYFLKKNDIPSMDIINSEFPELLPFLQKYPFSANEFRGLQCPHNPVDNTLYVYETISKNLVEYDIDSFIRKFNLGYCLNVIDNLKGALEPIYAFQRIWSKSKLKNIQDVSKIPFQDFDVVDFEFVKQANDAILSGSDILLCGFHGEGHPRTELRITSNPNELAMTLTCYFPNGNKKHTSSNLNGVLNGRCWSWYSNGTLKEDIEYFKNKILNKKTYYPSGNIEMSEGYDNENGGRCIEDWYDNGGLRRKTLIELSFGAAPKKDTDGIAQKLGSRMDWEFTESGVLIRETKSYYPNGLRGVVCGYDKIYFENGEIEKEIDFTNGIDKKTITAYKKKT